MRNSKLILSGLAIALIGCSPVLDDSSVSDSPIEAPVPEKDVLLREIVIEDRDDIISIQLPEKLTDANWGLKNIICGEDGYDLSKYAGQEVQLTKSPSDKYYLNEKLDKWMMSKDGEIICIYYAVGKSSGLVPGIFSETGLSELTELQ